MQFVDLNTFYNPRGGGIRTYHEAKFDWFRRHPEHQYLIVGPDVHESKEMIAPNIEYWALPGIQAQEDPEGYRALIDLRPLIIRLDDMPDAIVEVGDPWWSSHLFTRLRKMGKLPNPLTFFFHSDPLRTYIDPWSKRGAFQPQRKLFARVINRVFFRTFHRFDYIITSSKIMQEFLHEKHLKNVICMPFGAPQGCFDRFRIRTRKPGEPLKLLYAGRLQEDKDIGLIAQSLDEILSDENVELTVIGRGPESHHFTACKHPRLHYLGFVPEREKVEAIFDSHHALLAPGSWETFGLSVLEAMAMGMPVIGPDRGGTWELLQQLNSPLVFKTLDREAFVQQVQKLSTLPLEELSQEHHEVALRYGSWNDAMDRLMNFYLSKFGHH